MHIIVPFFIVLMVGIIVVGKIAEDFLRSAPTELVETSKSPTHKDQSRHPAYEVSDDR